MGGGYPGNGMQPNSFQDRIQERIQEGIRNGQIPVQPAQMPQRRAAPATMVPTDAVTAAINMGVATLDARMVDLIVSIRQASGLDEADGELDRLRNENAQLMADLNLVSSQLNQLRNLVGGAMPPPGPAPEEGQPSQ